MIWMIRHTTPAVEKGICYGQTDLALHHDYPAMREAILTQLPDTPMRLLTSPLQRCHLLATDIARHRHWHLQVDARLMEMNFGDWEMKAWNDIPEDAWKPWMDNFVHHPAPGGESFLQLHERCVAVLASLDKDEDHTLVTHGGVIRSALCWWHGTPLEEAFTRYQPAFGSITVLG